MPRIKHIGISTNDPGTCADFYINAFGLTEVERDPDNEFAVLSDGYINMTILRFKYDRYGGRTGRTSCERRSPGRGFGSDREDHRGRGRAGAHNLEPDLRQQGGDPG